MALLEVTNVKKIYSTRFGGNKVQALSNVTFSVEEGEYVAIMGPSGSGKSTLLHILGGVDVPTSGQVIVDQTDISTLDETALAIFRRRQIGLIYQFYNLIPILTVEENLTLPLLLDGNKPDPRLLTDLVERLGLEDRLKHLPNQLSGGQQQRVSIGRALMNNPALLLADEPTGNLDVETGKAIVELLHNICESGSSVVMTTHNLQLLKEYPGRVYRCAEHCIKDVTGEFAGNNN